MFPSLPPASGLDQDGGTASIFPRYEDVTQDGRLQLSAMMPGLVAAVWHALLSKLPALATLRAQGILPILSRLVLAGEERSVAVTEPVRYTGSFRFAREKNGHRLFVNMWVEAHAPVASTNGPIPPADAPQELVGRVFAEHVLTRPFAPPGQRRVTTLEGPDAPSMPESEHVFETADALVDRAGGPLEDTSETVFTMMHTDSNQHVNSLVYPRLFEEAALIKMVQDARIAPGTPLLSRAVELRWRRPFFQGERARLGMRLLPPAASSIWKQGAIGAFRGEGPKASSVVKMWFG